MIKRVSKKLSVSEVRRLRRKTKIRSKMSGTAERPRLVVNRTNTAVYAQLVDDSKGKTLLSAYTRSKELRGKIKNDIAGAKAVGELVAKKAEGKYQNIVFDRNGFLFHGKIKAIADGAKEAGLKF